MISTFKGRWNFLSNFYPVNIEYQGIKYPSVEHYYVAMKVKNDQYIHGNFIGLMDCRELIAKISTADKVKRFGKTLKVRKDWDIVKYEIMLWAIREKFKNDELSSFLLSTGEEELAECNYWHDNYWGICTCEPCSNTGLNNLGKILMQVRDELRK